LGLRNELKYYLSSPQALLLEKRLRLVMREDKNAGSDHSYQIRSLYFDEPLIGAYWDKINGLDHRTKFRIRYYNNSSDHIRLEKKEKIGSQTKKTGFSLSRHAAEEMAKGSPVIGFSSDPVYLEWVQKIRLEHYRPVCFVDYNRTAFVYPAGNVRITFDRHLSASVFRGSLFEEKRLTFPVMDSNLAILEVKFDSFLPPFLSALLEDVPKEYVAISKFCKCYEAIF